MKITRGIILSAAAICFGLVAGQYNSQTVSYAKSVNGYTIKRPSLIFKHNVVDQYSDPDTATTGSYRYSTGDKVKVTISQDNLDTSTPGTYSIIYHVTDKAGYNFHVKHYIRVRAVNLKSIYNPTYISDTTYKVSNVGDTIKLRPRFNVTTTANDVDWQSSNESVASVSSDGIVNAKENGIAVISASFHDKKVTTPVLVTGSSHLNLSSSDSLLKISYDSSYVSYKMTGDLTQYPTGFWVTNGQVFGYSDGIDESTTNANHRDTISKENGGIFTPIDGPSSLFESGNTAVLQTQDENGDVHQYVGNYRDDD